MKGWQRWEVNIYRISKISRWKFILIHDDIDEVTRALIKRKFLVPLPKPTTQSSFIVDVLKESKLYEFCEYHHKRGYAIKYYVTLLNKISDLINQKKVSFSKSKLYNKLKQLQDPEYEKNKNMGIFNNPFLNSIKARSSNISINFMSNLTPTWWKGTY